MNVEFSDLKEMRSNAVEASEFLKVMAHPERLMVLCQLTQGEVGVGELQSSSSLSQSAFSQHLTVLRKHNLIKARKESQQVFYSLSDPRVETLIQTLHSVFCGK
ncbi:metalloregulator ArsR/SmtB family transcription factor [Vibrio tubiashii]|uniref:metalloregulator ArsR/SmtB family transcription factor n=1 Tax=Vibrio tubiashii TaxID=29498 RepID=UPI001EFCAF81|nr:metalloregulator ArsR/SmtB family transcription factor [Vibrio tubiashii]MCG9580839.1 metalloregulator ArsR/SmtB family transcription factor [Vibrio tubiashii]MCG9614430.1 metalloregulator ArsR/SmtB family transcription factor [Vibrio tubiashii]MCG9689068.1 metalloregulator ArsR/SmtB family transcription factor [Vibrio tubiashii]